MPYATKRRANTEKILKQQARKCKKLSAFFTKNENAATSATMCTRDRTNVDRLSKLNMAPIDVPVEHEIEVPDVDPVTKESGQLELHKDNYIKGFKCNAQLARDTSVTTPPAPAQAPQASAQLTTEGFEATTEYYRGYPLDLTALTRRCGNDVLSLFHKKVEFQPRIARNLGFLLSVAFVLNLKTKRNIFLLMVECILHKVCIVMERKKFKT